MSQSRFGGAIAIAIAILAEIPVAFFVVVMVAAVLHGGLKVPDTVIETGVCIGTFVSVVLVWAVLYYGFLRRRTPSRPVLSFVLLLILPSLAAALVVIGQQRQHAFDLKRGQQGEEIALADLSTTVDNVIANGPRSYSVSLHTSLNGEPGRLEQSAKTLLFVVPEAYRQYINKRDALDIDGAISPKSLAANGGLDAATNKLVQVRAAIVAREAAIDAAFAACRKSLAAAGIDGEKKRAALAAFDTRIARGNARRAAEVEDELALYNEMMAIVGELKDARGSWRVRRGGIEIDSDAVHARIQDHWETIAEIEKRLRAGNTH
jgi:hypothetical protein